MHPSLTAAQSAARLPIYAQREEFLDAVYNHRVVIVEGPAGCGKTTQLPRMLMQAGVIPGRIGITQPRRIAAIGVASRIAEEENVRLGEEVGYAIRFDDVTSAKTRIKVMTDGILLQEARSDESLRAYDLLLVDEAHERSLNIDFTLGLLHRTLARRPDLKVVISSATLHPGHFQRFFGDVVGEVPVVRVPARLHPLSFTYAPPAGGGGPQALVDAATDAVVNLLARTSGGHVLVFLPGEGAITRVQAQLASLSLPNVLLLPLYGRLPQADQQRVFDDTLPLRKVILSTNIAETSITIDQTVGVVDCGLHKLPWHNAHTGVTTLREEPISKASAQQRAGRAGRTGPGEVVRLYAEASLEERPDFTREEILRIDLSEAVLRLIDLGIRDVENFAFPTPPPRGKLMAALEHLFALGAIDRERKLTLVGRRMVPYPLSPALARMVVEAATNYPDALSDVLLAGAMLSVRSPFTYPSGEEEAAQAAQAKLRHPQGDVMTLVGAYHRWDKAPDRPAFCRRSFIEPDTMQFVSRAHGQLVDIASKLGSEVRAVRGAAEHVLSCVATGFADKLLRREGYGFVTLQGLRVAVHPSSALYGTRAPFAVAAELMSSGRTYAFQVSALEPSWVAKASEEAARVWQLGRPRRPAPAPARAEQATATPEVSRELTLAGRTFALKGRRRPKLELAHTEAVALAQQGTLRPPAGADKVQARVVSAYGVVLRGTLAEVLALLPRLPAPGPDLEHKAPPAAIVSWDRSLHLVARHLPQLMRLLVGPQVVRPGWVALLHNGQGGVWFELLDDYVDALGSSLEALGAMRGAPDLAADDELRQALAATEQRLRGVASELSAAPALRRRLAAWR